jgi:thioredoxin reductase (NADPH)
MSNIKAAITPAFRRGLGSRLASGSAQAGASLRRSNGRCTHNRVEAGRRGIHSDVWREEIKARFVLLATGIVDESPDVPGLDEAVAKGSIRYCPVCDCYEATDQRIGVLGHGEDAPSKARFLRTYSNDVTLLSLDERGSGNTEKARSLREAGIKVAGPVRAIEYSADGMRAVLRGGKAMLFDVIYPALGCGVRSELASALGAKTNDVGCLEVDSHQRTTVAGIYAAGDVVSDLHQIAVATGHAAIAANHIHKVAAGKLQGHRHRRRSPAA